MKEYNKLPKSQESLKQILGASPVFLEQILQVARSRAITKTYKKIFNLLLSLHSRYQNIYPSEPWIANQVGCTERTVRRAITFFKSVGWIWWDRRWMDSNLYQIHPAFTVQNYRDALKKYFTACSFFMMIQLFVSVNAAGAVSDTNVRSFFSKNIREEKTKNRPRKRQSCIILPGRSAFSETRSPNLFTPIFIKNDSNLPQTTTDSTIINQLHCVLGCCEVINNQPEPKKGTTMSDRRMVDEVLKYITLNEEQLNRLEQYSDSQLSRALGIVQKAGNVSNPGNYFLGTLHNITTQGVTHKKLVSYNNNKTPISPSDKVVLTTAERYKQSIVQSRELVVESHVEKRNRLVYELDGWKRALAQYAEDIGNGSKKGDQYLYKIACLKVEELQEEINQLPNESLAT